MNLVALQRSPEYRQPQFLVKDDDDQLLAKTWATGLINRYISTTVAGLQSQWEADSSLSLDKTIKSAQFCLGRQNMQETPVPKSREDKMVEALEDLSLTVKAALKGQWIVLTHRAPVSLVTALPACDECIRILGG